MIDPLISKRQQLLLATQLCRMVLKVRDPSCFFPMFHFTSYLFCYEETWCHSSVTTAYILFSTNQPLTLCAFHCGERGSGPACRSPSHCARRVFVLPRNRTAGDVRGCTTFRSCPLILSILCFPDRPCLRPSPSRLCAILVLICRISLTHMQVNNVIIAGSDENEF